jgi:hypothetical protein
MRKDSEIMQSPQAAQDIISSLGIHRVIEPKGSLPRSLAAGDLILK